MNSWEVELQVSLSRLLLLTQTLIHQKSAVLGIQVTVPQRIYLQPHYCNGVFGNVYLLALDNTM